MDVTHETHPRKTTPQRRIPKTLARLGERRRERPRRRSSARLVRFALLAADDADLDEIRSEVDLCLAREASEYLPDLLRVDESFWDHHEKVGRRPTRPRETRDGTTRSRSDDDPPYFVDDQTLKQRTDAVANGRPPGIPFTLEPLVPDRTQRVPRLAPRLAEYNFLVLTLPLYEGELKRNQCNSRGSLFDAAYALTACSTLRSVSPDLAYPNYQPLSGFGGGSCPDGTTNEWHLDNVNYDAVPPIFDGSGSIIGHPDTGWTPHSELNFTGDDGNQNSPNIDETADINVFDPNAASAEEQVPSSPGFLRWRYHGTRTAGLLVSDATSGDDGDQVRGVAPGASVVSIRCVDGVVLLGDVNVALAIVAAVDAGVHVISISLGGYPAPILEFALQWAVANDVIVVAAAGNYWPFVVYPAAYRACIAVGGSTITDAVWDGSARNWLGDTPVDIAAPAECIRNATWTEDGAEATNFASGTSFATAMVAGAAALWLQRYNREFLIAGLDGRASLQDLFRVHLAVTARRPSGWNTMLDGPGILDFQGLMNRATLPDPRGFALPPDGQTLGQLAGPFPGAGSSTPGAWVEALFGSDAGAVVEQFGEELTTILLSDPVVASTVQAVEDAANAVEDAAVAVEAGVEEAVDDVEAFIEETTADVADAAEDTVDTIADWASETFSDWL